MIALLLAGALLFPLFSRPHFEQNTTTRVLIGLIFGITYVALSLNSLVLNDGGVLNASAGVLIFAAYLGGPVAGAMVLTVSLAIRAGLGGDMLILGLVMQAICVFAGLLLRMIRPFSIWPQLPNRILFYALGVFLVMHCSGVILAILLDLAAITPIASEFVVFILAGLLSVTVTWAVIQQSWRLASIERENGALLRQLQLIFKNCGIGVLYYNGRSGRLDFDPSFRKLYGLSENEVLEPYTLISRLVHAEDREAVKVHISNAIYGSGTHGSQLFRTCSDDDQLRHIRSTWQAESETPEGLRNLIGLHIDVTDVTTAQQQRIEAQQQIAAIAENLPGVIFQLIWQNCSVKELTYISSKSVDLWGLTQEAVHQAPCESLAAHFEAGEAEKVSRAINDAASNGGRGSTRVWMRGRSEKRIRVELQVQAMDLGNGTHLVNGIYVDITSESAAQEEADLQAALARQSQKNESIGRLTGGVAHDFNNILAIILSNLELLRDTVESDSQRAMIDAGIGASHRGAGLTRSMLSFARTASLDPEALDLNTVVRHAKNWMHRAMPESVEVEMSLLAGLWPVRLDASLLESALLNLIVNARDAMHNHGKLTIETANVRIDQSFIDTRNETISPGRYVMLAVSDTGSGIEADTLECMFDPFYTTKAPGEGSGIGLSMIQGFVKQSLGTIRVYTELGMGTSFKIYFPVCDTAPVIKHKKIDEVSSHECSGARILLVEDDENIREVQLAMLERGGYRVVTANSGDAALDIFNADSAFDLIVTDIVMPGELQGTTLASKVRETNLQIPFIFMSGYAAEATVHGNGLRPKDIRLMKPVPMSSLLNSVAAALKLRD
ncbi:Blue-light-activated protein [Granulosicoccus antarcticus IMCC3135]|uniref:histidine kinase n=2 Tax=Granulosicoccus TaxID=437504 RepID=A0A2Z2NMZ5_9GAMM|nr:Blue-light-activated protein [Granulosicoccus antarcticus IMCC3135]